MRQVPIKNYFIASVIIIITVVLTLYLRKMYIVNNTSYVDKEISYASLDSFLYENPEVIICFRDLKSSEGNFETVLKDNDLLDKAVYVNVKSLSQNDKIDFLNKFCSQKETCKNIFDAPRIVLIKDRQVIDFIDVKDDMSAFLKKNGWLSD